VKSLLPLRVLRGLEVPRPFRTVGVKLTLALAGLVAGALAIVYLAVVPSLEDRLIDSRLDQLERSAPLVINDIVANEADSALDDILRFESEQRGARVVVYEHLSQNPLHLTAIGDSRGLGQAIEQDPVA
jgi:hypothetical protein